MANYAKRAVLIINVITLGYPPLFRVILTHFYRSTGMIFSAAGVRGIFNFEGGMPDWAVQQLRVSLFSSGAISLSEAHWKIITGEDEANNRQAISGGKLYSGKSLGGLFTIGFSGNRCDVAATYDETSADPAKEATLPTFGSWDELSETFVKAVSPFVAGLEFPVVRMALGATVLDAAEVKTGRL